MAELIRVKNSGYDEYEELLLQRDKLKKEAAALRLEYMAVFGDLITAIFEEKIGCIRKKKMLAFCQAAANKGETVNPEALRAYLAREMQAYNKQLHKMIEENEAAHSLTFVSEGATAQIKKLYYKLAKQIHPDINPKTSEIPQLQLLWQMIVTAYNTNNLEDLMEAEVLVNKVLADNGISAMEVEIPDLEEKIQKVKNQILEIKSNNPYQYKFLLQDDDAIEQKKAELEKELADYRAYSDALEQLLNVLKGEEELQ